VTHGGALYFLAHTLLDRVPLGAAVMRFGNGGFTVVEVDGERVRLISLNETQHLQGLREQ
jgi:broad specificity phosphatase PhoE